MPSGIRPTQNVLRAAVFDILGHDKKGLTFLDLFSGSGAVGLEAISRGAKEVTMVEKDPKNAEAHAQLARVYLYQGNKQKAKSELEQVLMLDQNNDFAKKALEQLK